MTSNFVCGKIYKFIEDGEDLPIEHSYKTFFSQLNFNKDQYGYYSLNHIDEMAYVTIMSGTAALCLGEEQTKIITSDLRSFVPHKYYRLLIDDKIVILLHKEKNLYSFNELTEENS